MSNPVINIGSVANLFVRQMHFAAAGDSEEGHTHNFDHLSLLAKGRVKVFVNGEETEFTAPHMIYIRSDLEHTVTALTDGAVMYCIHAIRDDEGALLDPSMVPRGVMLRQLISKITNSGTAA